MTSMFWGLRLEPGKRYSTTVGRSFHVSMAALDCATVKNDSEINSVMLQEGEGDAPFILCNLQKQKNLQCPLDLNFLEGDHVTFYCKGNGTIHLSGYVHEDPDEFPQMDEEGEEEEEEDVEDEENEENEDEEEDDDEIEQALKELGKKKKKANGLPEGGSAAKKTKLDLEMDDEDDSEDDDDDDEGGSDLLEDDEDVDDEEDETLVKTEEEETKIKTEKKKKNKEPKQEAAKANGVTEQPKLSKKQKKKAKLEAAAAAASPKQEGTPKNQKDGAQEKKTLQGGVQIKDLVVGKGPVAKQGQKVQVYYVGRLKSNNKVFDQTKKGNGFSFHLGKGEVIKGWDVGVAGMKVGGKRTITCPANMAYGQKGSPPVIPPNSTLVFEVELRSLQ